jgi:hypothetical protein
MTSGNQDHRPHTAASLSFDPCGCSAHHDGHRDDCPTRTAANRVLRCEAWCDIAGTQTECDLAPGHEYEHEATHQVEVWTPDDVSTITNFIVWWGNDGHAFVGSDKAVDIGKIT